jgi:hypothetical protein
MRYEADTFGSTFMGVVETMVSCLTWRKLELYMISHDGVNSPDDVMPMRLNGCCSIDASMVEPRVLAATRSVCEGSCLLVAFDLGE